MPFDWMNVPPSCFCARNFVPKTARSTPVPGYKNRGGGWWKMEAPTHELLALIYLGFTTLPKLTVNKSIVWSFCLTRSGRSIKKLCNFVIFENLFIVRVNSFKP